MPTARAGLGVVVGSDELIYALGGVQYDLRDPLPTVEIYWPLTDRWVSGPQMLHARYDFGAVTGLDGRIYAMGGFTAEGMITDLVEVLDLATGSWSELPALPFPVTECAAAIDREGRIYVFGGFVRNAETDQIFRYEPDTATWDVLTPSTGRFGMRRFAPAAITAPDGDPLVVGGMVKDATGMVINDVLGATAVFRPANVSWTFLPGTNYPRIGFGLSATPNRNVYAVGGHTFQNGQFTPLAPIEVLDTREQTPGWKVIGEIPTPRSGLGVVFTDGRLFAIGGQSSLTRGGISRLVEFFVLAPGE